MDAILPAACGVTWKGCDDGPNEFAGAFNSATEVILCDIYAARETDHGEVSSKDLLNALVKEGVKASHFETFEQITDYVVNHAMPQDLVITMGAGDVNKISLMILNALK